MLETGEREAVINTQSRGSGTTAIARWSWAGSRNAEMWKGSRTWWDPNRTYTTLEGARASTGLCVDVGSGVMI